MKKLVSVLFCLIPLTFSCGKRSSLDFENPFPGDALFNKHSDLINPIEDEIATAPVSDDEKQLLLSTIDGEKIQGGIVVSFARYITKATAKVNERDYTRAFANQFKQGYSASNLKKDSDTELRRQEYDESSDIKKRTFATTETEETKDYAYGQIQSETKRNDIKYFCAASDESAFPDESTNWSDAQHGSIHLRSAINDTDITDTFLGECTPPSSGDSADEELTQISEGQKYFLDLFAAGKGEFGKKSDTNEIVLIYRNQSKHKNPEGSGIDDGIYQLADGRQFRAMDASIEVARLVLVEALPNAGTLWSTNWYLVKHTRVYTETVVTSEEIEPNVPYVDIDPVTVHFTQTTIDYSIDPLTDQEYSKGPLPGTEASL